MRTKAAAAAQPEAGGGLAVRDLGDLRTRRAYSGRYWQVSRVAPDGAPAVLARSRSLWDTELGLEAGLARRLEARPSGAVSFAAPGPEGQKLRVRATRLVLPGDVGPVIVLAAEDRRSVDADVRGFYVATVAVFGLLGWLIVHCYRGEGRTPQAAKVNVRIPPGVDTGTRLRSSGNGEAGLAGGQDGDLYIVLNVKQHELFERQEDGAVRRWRLLPTQQEAGDARGPRRAVTERSNSCGASACQRVAPEFYWLHGGIRTN
jgi:hypothetical protein